MNHDLSLDLISKHIWMKNDTYSFLALINRSCDYGYGLSKPSSSFVKRVFDRLGHDNT